MSIAVTTSQISYAGDGVATALATTFKFIANGHLTVDQSTNAGSTWTTKTEGVSYTVTGADADEPGGTVTMLVAPPISTITRITRNTPITQPIDFLTHGPFSPATHMESFDRLTMIAQEAARRLSALEAGTVGSTYTAVQVTDTFTVLDPPETTYPRTIAAGITPATCVLGRVENLTTPGEELEVLGGIDWTASGTNVSLKGLPGLTVGQQYRIRLEVRS